MSALRPSDVTTPYFSIETIEHGEIAGINTLHVHASDRFHSRRHALERRLVTLFTRTLDRYLRKRPHLTFDHPRNHVRRIVYFPPAFRAWTAYMPGGFATYSVHNPDHKRLYSGKKVDLITKNLFRHSTDAIGLRSRAYAMAWIVHYLAGKNRQVRWLSLAAGTGQPTFDAAKILPAETTFYLCDIDGEALRFARQLAKSYDIDDNALYTSQLDINREGVLERLMHDAEPNVIDAMGFFEYIDDDEAVEVLATMKKTMRPDSVFVFTNMLSSRKQLDIHKRGMGWPGVIPRSVEQVALLMTKAGIAKSRQTVILPDDGVYAVYVIGVGAEHV